MISPSETLSAAALPAMRHTRSSGKRDRTRAALVQTAIELIGEKGIEGATVLGITERLGLSNGLFYHYFQNMEGLLESVGHTVVAQLVASIYELGETTPDARVARGPLIVLRFLAARPELGAIMLRVIEDGDRRHRDLSDRLVEDITAGIEAGLFRVTDARLAAGFCRGVIGVAVRSWTEGENISRLDVATAVQTLTMLGVPLADAEVIVERERHLVDGRATAEKQPGALRAGA